MTQDSKKPLTIGEANDALKKIFEHECSFPLFDDLATFARRNDSDSFNNDSYIDAVLLTRYMFNHTNESLCMLTGHGGEIDFLKTIEKSFARMLERIREAGHSARIVFLADHIPGFIKEGIFKPFWEDKTLKCCTGRVVGDKPVQHYIVCDSNMIRIEEPHAGITKDSPINIIKAKMYFDSKALASAHRNVFDRMWNRLTGGAK